jgi:molecular chaperone Hsp33
MNTEPQTDHSQRFLFAEDQIRGEWVRLEHSLAAALGNHDYDARVERLLIEAILASVLMSSTLKFEGKLILQAQGSGPVTLLAAEATHQRTFRAIAHARELLPGTIDDLPGLLGNAQLAITLAPTRGQRYQGIVPMEHARLATCLEHYFATSEQLNTHIFLAVDGRRAVGLILQKLPDDKDTPATQWQHILHLVRTLSAEEALAHDNATLMHRLFHQEQVRLYPEQAVRFACSCSEERSRKALETLGQEEVLGLLEEMPHIEIKCEFCARIYEYNRSAVLKLFALPPQQ